MTSGARSRMPERCAIRRIALVLGLGCLVFAWFRTGPKAAATS